MLWKEKESIKMTNKFLAVISMNQNLMEEESNKIFKGSLFLKETFKWVHYLVKNVSMKKRKESM
jgi:hypothetical protein